MVSVFNLVSLIYLALIYGLPLAAVALLFGVGGGLGWTVGASLCAPLLYSTLFVTVAGILSLPYQKAIIPGKFPRDVRHPIYGPRRLYGLCWTAVYYCKPVYYLCLSIPLLKSLTFRLFGYRGSMQFTIYPDTWIRDLPLLDFGKGAYISNRATVGTNMVLTNGRILVDRIVLEERALVGHLCMLAPGVRVGRSAEIGAGCAVGIRTLIGDDALIGPTTALEHGVEVGARVSVGAMSFVGSRSFLEPGLRLPQATIVPARSKLRTRTDAPEYVLSADEIAA